MTTHYISFRKLVCGFHEQAIRIEFAIPAVDRQEARRIVQEERRRLRMRGYRYIGSN